MDPIWQSLRAALSKGHQQLAEGLSQMVVAIRNDDYEAVAKLAEHLDCKAGPHVEFEERYLYPIVEQEFGEAYAMQLYDEHTDSIATLIELQRLDPHVRPSNETKQIWLDALQNAIEHLTTSYPLLNCLQSMLPEQQKQLLERHAMLYQRGHRWSQLHPPSDDSVS